MSKIVNEPKIKNPIIVAVREQLEHRALWMYLLCDEAAKKRRITHRMRSTDADFIRAASCAKKPAAAIPLRV